MFRPPRHNRALGDSFSILSDFFLLLAPQPKKLPAKLRPFPDNCQNTQSPRQHGSGVRPVVAGLPGHDLGILGE